MKQLITLLLLGVLISIKSEAQETIPFDTLNWNINAQGFVLENFKGKDAIYLHNGAISLKNTEFLNGTIEYDIYITERRGFPGINFRKKNENNMELFYFRPHQSGNPDANQATPVVNGITGWQLYFGPSYSFLYEYNFDNWMHVKLVVRACLELKFCIYSILFSIILEFAKNTQATELSTVLS